VCVRVCVCVCVRPRPVLHRWRRAKQILVFDSFAFLPALFGVRFHLLLGVAAIQPQKALRAESSGIETVGGNQ